MCRLFFGCDLYSYFSISRKHLFFLFFVGSTGYLVANFARLCGGPQRLVPEGRADRGQIRALGPCWGEGGLEFGESWPLSVYIYIHT